MRRVELPRDRGALLLGGGVLENAGESFSFVSRRNKGISDDKCQVCTRSTGSVQAKNVAGMGMKEDVGSPPFRTKRTAREK